MTHFVAQKLGQRPNDILDNWSVPELLVAFGQYANEQSTQNYEEWNRLDSKQRANIPRPNKYAVYFEKI